MYEYLKMLLDVAEKVGEIETAELKKRSEWRANGVEINGTTANGEKFEITLEVGEREPK